MNEWRLSLSSFLNICLIGKEMAAFNHRGEARGGIPIGLFSLPADKKHLDRLRSANFFQTSVWVRPSRGSADIHILVCSTLTIDFHTQHSNLEKVWVCTWAQVSISLGAISPLFDCQRSMGRGSAHQPAWRMAPSVVACFLNVLLIQEVEGHGGWLAVASHYWFCLWVVCLPTVT